LPECWQFSEVKHTHGNTQLDKRSQSEYSKYSVTQRTTDVASNRETEVAENIGCLSPVGITKLSGSDNNNNKSIPSERNPDKLDSTRCAESAADPEIRGTESGQKIVSS